MAAKSLFHEVTHASRAHGWGFFVLSVVEERVHVIASVAACDSGLPTAQMIEPVAFLPSLMMTKYVIRTRPLQDGNSIVRKLW